MPHSETITTKAAMATSTATTGTMANVSAGTSKPKTDACYIPTPEQIAAECVRICAEWPPGSGLVA